MAYVLGLVVYIRFMEGIWWIYSVHRGFINGAQKLQEGSLRVHGPIEDLYGSFPK